MKRVRGFVLRAERTMLRETAARGLEALMLVQWCTLICFDVEAMKSEEVVKRLLEKRIVASTAPYKNSYARIAPSLLNTPEEIETTLRYIQALA